MNAIRPEPGRQINWTKVPIDALVLLSAISDVIDHTLDALDRKIEMQAPRGSCESPTLRERKVVALAVSGLSNRQIGGDPGISKITVNAQRDTLIHGIGVASFADVVCASFRLLIIPKS
ncbi:MAG: LuxR C-terminal-related transcriptional regulator [Bryobacteraceae bacterium]